MPRLKKEAVNLNMRVDKKAMELFDNYCKSTGRSKTAAFERLVFQQFTDSAISTPSYPDIDFIKIAEAVGKEDIYDDWDPVTLHRAEKLVLDSVFEAFAPRKYSVKDYPQKNTKVYEFKKFECYLAVYLQGGNITYTIRLNTLNSSERVSVVYFSVDHMAYYIHSLLFRTLRDFSNILHMCAELCYTPEGHYKDSVPRGFCIDKEHYFANEREKELIRPCHYYSGFMSESGEYIELPFDEWLEEIRSTFTGNTKRGPDNR